MSIDLMEPVIHHHVAKDQGDHQHRAPDSPISMGLPGVELRSRFLMRFGTLVPHVVFVSLHFVSIQRQSGLYETIQLVWLTPDARVLALTAYVRA